MAEASPPPQQTDQSLPLFYKEPQLLTVQQHADWRLKDGDFRFAGAAIAVPIVAGEFNAALRDYPILFATSGDEVSPIVLFGMEEVNLWVTDGRWEQGAYVPAYVRRYPFVFVKHGEQLALAIDAASGRFAQGGSEGVALFEDGKPSAITQDVLRFCDAFRADSDATTAFCQALKSKNLLVDQHANATLANGRTVAVGGFQVIDEARLTALDAGTIVEWHNKGYLALAHLHLASLGRFEQLFARRNAREAQFPPAAAGDAPAAANDAPA